MATIPSGRNTMNEDKSYNLKLPVQAIQYLQMAAGVIELPLLGLPKQIDLVDFLFGQRWLIENKLIQKDKSGTGINPLLIATVQWISDPDWILVYQTVTKQGVNQKALVYGLHDKELMVLRDDNALNLYFFERVGDAHQHLSAIWILDDKKEYPPSLPVIPQPETAIPLAWHNPELFMEVMNEWGIRKNECLDLITYLNVNSKLFITAYYAVSSGSPKFQTSSISSI